MPIFSFIGYTLTELFRKPDNWRETYKQMSSTFYSSNDVSKNWEEKNMGYTKPCSHPLLPTPIHSHLLPPTPTHSHSLPPTSIHLQPTKFNSHLFSVEILFYLLVFNFFKRRQPCAWLICKSFLIIITTIRITIR